MLASIRAWAVVLMLALSLGGVRRCSGWLAHHQRQHHHFRVRTAAVRIKHHPVARFASSTADELGGVDEATDDAQFKTSASSAPPLPKFNRPTVDDVVRISWGKPAKKKGTGSRGVPHRLNSDERIKFDFALTKGFVEIDGSGWRSQRRDSPLSNSYRNYCDAKAQPVIAVHKMKDGQDQVLLDLSPLREPQRFAELAGQCAPAEAPPSTITWGGFDEPPANEAEAEDDEGVLDRTKLTLAEWRTEAIFRLPVCAILWELPRGEAKALAKQLAKHFDTVSKEKKAKTKNLGMPKIKPGKGRRHGGYGIG